MNIVKTFIFAATSLFLCLAIVHAEEQVTLPAVIDISSTTVNDSFHSTKIGTYKNSDFIKISLTNKIFSPTNTNNMPTELVMNINVLDENVKVKKCRLDLINSRKENIYTVSSDIIPSVIKWNGIKDKDIAEGKYKYIFTVEIWKKDKVTVQDTNIVVDVTPPLTLLKSSTDVGVISNNKLLENFVFALSASDETGIDLSKTNLKILNTKNNMKIKSWTFQNAEQQDIFWDGKDDIYDRLVPAGEYQLVLNTSDIAGNESLITKNISVIEFDSTKTLEDIVVREKPKALSSNVNNTIFFKSASADLTETAIKSLDILVKLLTEYPANEILIEGHTDSFESKKTKNDLLLSNKRAQSVSDFFIKNGVEPKRIQAVGYGQAKPRASNQDTRTRILNRRADIIVLKNNVSSDEIHKND